MSEVTAGIDIGTTSVKGLLVDAAGHVLAAVRHPHRPARPPTGRLEHDAAASWWEAPRRVLAELGRVRTPAAASVVAMVPSMCAVDAAGRPTGPGLLYGDERGRGPHRAVDSFLGEAVGFVRWLAGAAPTAAGYWPAQAVANHRLAGRPAISRSTAVALYPLHDGTGWDPALVPAGSSVPEVVDDASAIGGCDGVTIDAGGIDALAEQLVSGAEADGDVLVICGSSLVVWAVIPQWRTAPGLWTVPHTVAGKFLIGGSTNAGGIFLDWVAGLLGPHRGSEPTPSVVPVWAPYPRGERTPLHDPTRRAALHGLTVEHDAAAVRRAAYEASGFVVRQHLDLAGVQARRLVVTGGGAGVDPWVQALADCTGLPADVVAVPAGAALGAAFTARVTAGLEAAPVDARRWARTARRVTPRASWGPAVDERYQRFLTLARNQP